MPSQTSDFSVLAPALAGLYRGDKIDQLSGIDSAMAYKVSMQELRVNLTHVDGDKQADLKHHGGLDRVLHHIPLEHYQQYQAWGMMQAGANAPAMGENISSLGLDESEVNIGDIVRIGEVELQVTQPRAPCFKLNLQFGHQQMAYKMQTSGKCGWFYRVIKPGVIRVTDSVVLLSRHSDISVAEAMDIYFLPEFDAEKYQRLLTCHGLAKDWVDSLTRRLAEQRIEDWQMRLYGTGIVGAESNS